MKPDIAWEYGPLSARVYQLDKPVGKSLNGDIEFYSDQLSSITGKICEPAVGTGRMLVPLLKNGLDVHGYDTSDHMLEICRRNCHAAGIDADVFLGDMTTYCRPTKYEAILVPTGSIILLPDRLALADALRNMRESLTHGGWVFIDVPAPFSVDTGNLRHWWDGDELLTLQTMHVENDPAEQKITTWLRYELWREGQLADTQLQLGGMQWFGMYEFRQLLGEAGFADVKIFGDYRDGPVTADSSIWTFKASRSTTE